MVIDHLPTVMAPVRVAARVGYRANPMRHTFAPQRIVVATDFSDASAEALRTAILVADAFGGEVCVVYADDFFPLPGESELDGALLRVEAETRLERWTAAHAHGHSIDTIVAAGFPVTATLQSAEQIGADLIVLGTHVRRGFERLYLGSFAEAVLRSSKIPVLTVRRGVRAIRSIACGVDCTDDSLYALESAIEWGEVFHAQVTVVNVIEPGDRSGHTIGELEAWIPPELRARCQCKELVIRGGISERLVSFAANLKTDLIIIGGKRYRIGASWTLPDMTERVVRRARCAVLAIIEQPARADAVEVDDSRSFVTVTA